MPCSRLEESGEESDEGALAGEALKQLDVNFFGHHRAHMVSRLLHPQHLDGIWIGQDLYRLPLAPLNEVLKIVRKGYRENLSFLVV